jgi:hypothetical protein
VDLGFEARASLLDGLYVAVHFPNSVLELLESLLVFLLLLLSLLQVERFIHELLLEKVCLGRELPFNLELGGQRAMQLLELHEENVVTIVTVNY